MQQEAIRGPARDAYLKAKLAEKDSADKRLAVLDLLTALQRDGDKDLAELAKERTEAANALVARRDERRRVERTLDVALNRAGGDANAPAVKEAHNRLEELDAQISRLQRRIAIYEQLERDKISVQLPGDVLARLVQANLDLYRKQQELDRVQQKVLETFVAYLQVLRPAPPPYLESVQVYAGAKAIYRAEWRIDDKAADAATRELNERLDRAIVDSGAVLRGMQELRDELRDKRTALLGPMNRHSLDVNLAASDINFAGQMVIIAPAAIEAVGVIIEAMLTGGASTAERQTVEQAVNAGTAMAGALAKKQAGKPLSAAERALAAIVEHGDEVSEPVLGGLQTALAKERADRLMDWRANKLIDRLGLKPGSSDAAKILVSDAAEQVIGRIARSGTAVLSYKTAMAWAAARGANLTKWQAVRSGAVNFFTARTPIDRIKDGLKGSRSGNILGLSITAAKTVVAAYYGAKLGEAEERYVEALVEFALDYEGYYSLLQAERLLLEYMEEEQDFHFQAFAYRLQSAGPRQLVVLANEGDNDPTETLTFALHFSQSLDRPPRARIAGLVLDMKPLDADDKGRAAHWEGKLAARTLPNNVSEAVLEVSPGIGSRPYATLDSDPRTPPLFLIPDDLDRPLPDREEWSGYERGSDRNHRIALRPPTPPQTVPWRGASTCSKINCDCAVIPITPGLAGDADRNLCLSTEDALRRDCVARKQTFATCPPNAGPAAYPSPAR